MHKHVHTCTHTAYISCILIAMNNCIKLTRAPCDQPIEQNKRSKSRFKLDHLPGKSTFDSRVCG